MTPREQLGAVLGQVREVLVQHTGQGEEAREQLLRSLLILHLLLLQIRLLLLVLLLFSLLNLLLLY